MTTTRVHRVIFTIILVVVFLPTLGQAQDLLEQNQPTDCNQAENRDTCLVQLAYQKRDATLCQEVGKSPDKVSGKLKTMDKTACYQNIAEALDDLKICDYAQEQQVRYECYVTFAQNKQDPAICSQIPLGPYLDFPDSKKSSMEARDVCYHAVALATNNLEICQSMQDPYGREVCKDSRKIMEEMFKVPVDKVFRDFLADPVPDDVQILEGSGSSWLDYGVSVVFATSQDTFDKLSAGYQQLPGCAQNKESSSPRLCFEDKAYFSEDLTGLPGLSCYHKAGSEENRGDYYLLWDKEKHKAYFCSESKGFQG